MVCVAFREQQVSEQIDQLQKDIAIIEQYLEDNNIRAIKTKTGVFYIKDITTDGRLPTVGDKISVHYDGKLISGKVFDSSYDRGNPFDFPLGHGQVIAGWDIGLALFKEGEKGRLFVPSPLAYGRKGVGDLIIPNSILIFDIELVKINE